MSPIKNSLRKYHFSSISFLYQILPFQSANTCSVLGNFMIVVLVNICLYLVMTYWRMKIKMIQKTTKNFMIVIMIISFTHLAQNSKIVK